MIVNFNFNYALELHDRHIYISAIEKDGEPEENAYKKALVIVHKNDIKSLIKSQNGAGKLMFRTIRPSIETIESYEEIVDAIQKANKALDIMNQEKIYIFDDFKVDSDELNIVDGWDAIKQNMGKE